MKIAKTLFLICSVLCVSADWTYDYTDPDLRPLSIDISVASNRVALGSQDAPVNSRSETVILDLTTGKQVASVNASSRMAIAKDTADFEAAGTAWYKTRNVATARAFATKGPRRNVTVDWAGEPAFNNANGLSADGRVFVALIEPTPDPDHINNRSGTLHFFDRDSKTPDTPVASTTVVLGAQDPLNVALAPLPGAAGSGRDGKYLAVGLLGSFLLVVDFDPATGKLDTYISKDFTVQGMAASVSAAGDTVAFAWEANCNIYTWDKVSATFKEGPPVKSPFPSVLLTPVAAAFPRLPQPGGRNILAVGWQDANMVIVGVSLHDVSKQGPPAWTFNYTCARNAQFNLLSALEVSPSGRAVAVGSWGCTDGAGPTVMALDGRTGEMVFHTRTKGWVWDVAAEDSGKDGGASTVIGYAAWPSQNGRDNSVAGVKELKF